MARSYPLEFRRGAIDLVRSGEKVSDVSAQLGISVACLHKWVRQDRVDKGECDDGDALTSSEREELSKLRREVRRLRMQTEFLKKAAAFFATESQT